MPTPFCSRSILSRQPARLCTHRRALHVQDGLHNVCRLHTHPPLYPARALSNGHTAGGRAAHLDTVVGRMDEGELGGVPQPAQHIRSPYEPLDVL